MNIKIGDWVVHCIHGLGQVQAIEEKTNGNKTVLYYAIQLKELVIWVPVDENQNSRLRLPASAKEFRRLLATLSHPAEQLSNDRRQRNLQLLEMLNDGSVESICRVLRNLAAHRHQRTWNEYDNALMSRAQKALIVEWSFVFAIPSHEAEVELQRLLSVNPN
jgi:RNA polymerase-interacting CarD/CdnL/TRCF family regulator